VLIGTEIFSETLLRHEFELAPCPVRSVAAATFAFYLADSISSVHEFTPIDLMRLVTRRFCVQKDLWRTRWSTSH
jgi:hypothetical protein